MQSFWWHTLSILSIEDVVEILLFSLAIYLFCLWLKKDHNYRLIGSFYILCALFIGAYAAELHTVTSLFQLSWPAIIVVFLIIHKQQLQKNYISYKTVTPARKTASHDWINSVLRAVFLAVHNKKSLIFIIEGAHALDELLIKGTVLEGPVTPRLLDMVISSQALQDDTLIWINQTGHLVAINCTWKKPVESEWIASQQLRYRPWEQEALFWTNTCDALVLHACPQSHALTIVAQATRVQDISSDEAQSIVTQYLRKMSLPMHAQEKSK